MGLISKLWIWNITKSRNRRYEILVVLSTLDKGDFCTTCSTEGIIISLSVNV